MTRSTIRMFAALCFSFAAPVQGRSKTSKPVLGPVADAVMTRSICQIRVSHGMLATQKVRCSVIEIDRVHPI